MVEALPGLVLAPLPPPADPATRLPVLAVLVSGEPPKLAAMLTPAVVLAALAPALLPTLVSLPGFSALPALVAVDSIPRPVTTPPLAVLGLLPRLVLTPRLTPPDPLPALPALLSADALPALPAPPALLEFEEPAAAGPAPLATAGAKCAGARCAMGSPVSMRSMRMALSLA